MCVCKLKLVGLLLTGSLSGNDVQLLSELANTAARESSVIEAGPVLRRQRTQDNEGNHLPGLIRTLRPRFSGAGPLAFSPDGKTLATAGGYDQLCLWNLITGEQRGQLKIKQFPHPWVKALAYSPDGKTLAAGYVSHEDKVAVRLWEVDTGKVKRELRVTSDHVFAIAFSPDGRIIAGAAGSEQIYLWETTSGKELHRLERKDARSGEYGLYGLALSPDGKTLAVGGGKVTVWDVTSGKRLWQFNAVGYFVAFLPDGKTLVAAGLWYLPGEEVRRRPLFQPTVYLWDLATGKERHLVREERQGDFRCLAASPDGRMLVTGGTGDGGRMRLWEVATGKERCQLGRYDTSEFTAAFSPDGRTLATSAGEKVGIRIWDVLRVSNPADQTRKPTPDELKSWWADLANADAVRAYRAICFLVHCPDDSLPFLQEHLRRLPQPDPSRIGQLILEADSQRFETREKAMEELEKMGKLAETALRKVLAGNPSLELRQRVEKLVEKLDGPVICPDRLRAIRGLEILEHVGTSEAKRVLEELSKGTPGTDLTEGAKAAMGRLKKRVPVEP